MAMSLAGLSNAEESTRVFIELDLDEPPKSSGSLVVENEETLQFSVGYGRRGVLDEGARFKGGYSLLGRFRVNAIFAADQFEMTPKLVESSGKSREFLSKELFANMSSIDFDGDGKGGEYGAGFIGLQPLTETEQPFSFEPYQGVFRWYSYAIHGTQNEARIGKKITGGCINVGAADLQQLLAKVKLGDIVEIQIR
ncbi:MAG: hypothetical protein ACI8UO_005849 [Verrucomicrobiales bacterium]|jgi:hypothetical protein